MSDLFAASAEILGSRKSGRGVPSESLVPVPRVRVLHIIQNLNYGGMERLLADLIRGLNADRFDSHVLVLQYLGRFAEEMLGYASLHQAPRQHRLSMGWPRMLARTIRAIRPDVVHTHSGVWYKASLAARMAKVPWVIHTDHGRQSPDPWRSRLLDGLAARRTDRVVAVSDALRDVLSQTVVPDPDRISVILNGVDTERHRPRPDAGRLRQELGIETDVPILGSIGRLETIKGFDIMVEAFAELCRRSTLDVRPHLVVAGDGSQRPLLEQRAISLGVGDRIHFVGWRDDVEDLHSAFTLFTMSSRSEGTSISLLEAMSAGICPVVTEVGGNAAVLGSELRHRLVPSGDVVGLATAWQDALLHSDLRAADGAAARRRVEEAYGLAAMVQEYERLYARSG